MEWAGVIALIGVVSGIVLGWTGRTKTIKQEVAQEAEADGVLQTDVTYIKRGIDDIRADVRAQGQKVEVHSERITRLEESYKSIHKRVDRIEGGG